MKTQYSQGGFEKLYTLIFFKKVLTKQHSRVILKPENIDKEWKLGKNLWRYRPMNSIEEISKSVPCITK
jgi:hypothetical protein